MLYNPNPEVLPGYSQTNSPLVNKKVCLKFSILDAISAVEYQETIETTTDEFGMVNLTIGTGNPIGGYAALFEDIVWDSTSKKLKVDIDVSGNCATFLEISNQPFTAVPFAFAAKTAENVTGIVAITNGGTGANTIAGAKTNLGLNNVDNTSDLNKPISSATQAGLNLKENTANKSDNVNLGTSTVLFPTQNAVKVYVDNKINSGGAELAIEILRATNAENTLTTNLNSEITRATAAENSKENTVNKSDDVNLGTSTVLFPTQNAVKTYVDNQVTMATPDASTLNKGKIKLAGDLTGTADLPLVKNEAITSAKIANGTIINEDIANATITTAKIDGAISVVNGGTGADLSTSLGYIKHAAIGANFTTVSPIPATDVFGAVRFVNGSPADTTTGNVAVPFGFVTTGLFTSRPAISATNNGDIFVISGETGANASDNGRTFISTGATGTWNEVTSNQASTDARYVQLSGSTMLGSLAFPTGTKVTVTDAPTSSNDLTNKTYVDDRTTIVNTALTAEITRATGAETTLSTNLATEVTRATTAENTKEDKANKSTDVTLADTTNSKFPTELAVKTYVDGKSTTLATDLQTEITNRTTADTTINTALTAEITRATGAETTLSTNLATEVTRATTAENTKEDKANKSTDVTLADSSNTKFPTELAVKTYVDGKSTTLATDLQTEINNRTAADTTINTALTAEVTRATTAENTKEDKANKSTDVTLADSSNTKFPTELAVKTYVDNQVTAATPNATNTVLGKIQLAGDLAGSNDATNPVITNSAITTIKIADANVTEAKLSANAVTTDKILDGTILVNDLANDAVETSKIKDSNVTTAKIADANVTTAKIAQGAADQVLKTNTAGTGVEWGKLSAANLVGKDLTAADASITVVNGVGATLIDSNVKVTDLGITAAKLAASAVTTDKITDANVTEAKLAADAVTSTKIVDGTIATADLGNNSISTDKIIDANVTEVKLASGAVTTLKLANDAVTTAKIANGTIINDDIADATITTAKISGTIAIAQGGTGATTATGALTNLGAEAVANKATAIDMGGANANNVKYPTQLAVKTFLENSLNSGVGTATQTALNLKEDIANKSTAVDLGAGSSSNTAYPSQLAVKTYVDAQIIANATADASTSVKGKIKLDGDLTGTADLPLVKDNAITTSKIVDDAVTNAKLGETITVANGGTGAISLTGYLKGNGTSAFTAVSPIPVTDVSGAVRSVNGVFPDNTSGNVAVAIGRVFTGIEFNPDSAASVLAINSGPNPIKESDIYIVSGQTGATNDNGRTFIHDGNDWLEISTNIAALENTFVKLSGSTMSGNLVFPSGNKITIVSPPSGGTDVTNKTYVDSLVASGTTNATTTATGKIQLAGDLTGTATAPEIGANKVTFTKIQTVSSGVVLGRSSTGTGNIEALTTIPVATLPALTGDVTTSAGSAVTTIAQNAVTLGKIQNLSAQSKLLGTPSTGGLGVAEISLGTGLTMTNGTLSATGGTVTNVTGTTDRITVTNGATTPTVDIASTYAGQSSITTLGTITTGTWNGSTISVPKGGTGATTLTGYVKGTGTTAMIASTSIPVADVTGAQTITNKSTDGTFAGSNDTNYPSQLAVKTYVDSKVAAATLDATTTATGKIQLAGDLTGSATAPVVGTGKITSDKILDGTIATVDIAASAVTTTLIADGTITTADLGVGAVTNAKIGETITVANGGTGATTLTGYVKGTGTTAMIASTSIPVADVTGAQTVANLSANIATNTGSISMYPSVAAVETALALKAPLASPALTGTPTAPTAAAGTSTTQIATTEFVASALGSPFFIAAATPTVDALGNKTSAIERSGSIQTSGGSIKSGKSNYIFEMNGNNSNGPVLDLGDSSNSQKFWRMGAYGSINNFDTKNRDFHIFSTNATTGIYFKNDTGRVGIGTNAPSEKFQVNGNIKGDKIIKTGGVASEFLKADGSVDTIAYAPLASPTFTGVPAGPTATAGTNTTQLATTAFVTTALAAATIADATATTKGKIQLAGDLGGTAAAPLVAKLQGTVVSATAPTTNQLLLYDGTSWKPVSKSAIVTMETEEFTPTASQTSFTLTNTPLGKIAMYINGVRVPKAAVSVSGTTVTYVPASNSAYAILVTDRVSFDYIY